MKQLGSSSTDKAGPDQFFGLESAHPQSKSKNPILSLSRSHAIELALALLTRTRSRDCRFRQSHRPPRACRINRAVEDRCRDHDGGSSAARRFKGSSHLWIYWL